ncbi:MAG: type II toxin-antitoxin system RelE/ParE family toxin [Gemmataceae bacterium]|nr:type II toxin-antitoxin system RelE/ParE family toxin [Gemmataceae bacterium]
MRRVARTVRAQSDLDDILTRMTGRSPTAADRFAAEFDARCALLAGQPKMGRPRDDLAPGLRSVVIDRHVLFYRFDDATVTVVRIVHGSRDVDALVWDD